MDDQVSLRPVREEDLALLQRVTNDPEGSGPYAWNGWSDPHVWGHRWSENGLLGSAAGTLMVSRGAEPAGFISWRQVITGPSSHCWELGVGLVPEARGLGVGTEAHRLIVGYLFAHTVAHRIQAVTETGNLAEQRALEKAGFTREGVVRGFGFRNGRWRDGVLYSILRDDVDLDGAP